MAGRQNKVGLDYFELDCHMDDKVKLIQAEFGLKGFAVVVKLYQRIYSGNGYYCEWNEDVLLLFMSENGLPSDNRNLINEIVMACIRRDIFSETMFKKYGILTSCGVQKRYLNATARRDNVGLKKEYLLISVPKNLINVVINSINVSRNSINDDRNSQSKENESKEKNKNIMGAQKRFSPPSVEEVDAYCRERGNTIDAQQFVDFYKSKDWMIGKNKMKDWKAAVRTWERSRKEKEKAREAPKGTKFSNFQQRDYDFAELEKQLINR